MSTGTLDETRTRPDRSTQSVPTRSGRPGRADQARTDQRRTDQRRADQRRADQRRADQRRRDARADRSSGIVPFVLVIMVLLTSGLVATLWLSTAAAADSYRLDSARRVARDLSEQTERLHRDVESAQSAPALAASATGLGMVPAGTPAVLIVAPDGSSRVVGDARPVRPASVPSPSVNRIAHDPDAATQTSTQAGQH